MQLPHEFGQCFTGLSRAQPALSRNQLQLPANARWLHMHELVRYIGGVGEVYLLA